MTDMSGRQWCVVQTRPHAEAKAAAHLTRQGFGIYLPRYLKRRRHARKVEVVAAPLFPRYLFVAVDMAAQRWRSIQSTIGVSHLVCSGENVAAVASGVIDNLKKREDDRGYVRLERRPLFAPGDKVRVIDGVFAACLGLFEGMSDRERVAVLVDLLGRKVRIVMDADLVTAA